VAVELAVTVAVNDDDSSAVAVAAAVDDNTSSGSSTAVFSTTLHMYDIDVGSVWSESIASNTTQPYSLWPGSYPEYKLVFQA